MKKAFTLVEVLMVVAILGIIAAIVFPEYRSQAQKAKESAAKENLQILRHQIELYVAEHNGIAPGYPDDDTSNTPLFMTFARQMTKFENRLSSMPKNPFNGIRTMKMINNTEPFPTEPTGPAGLDTWGWIYKPATREIRLNWPGNDSQGVPYFEY